MKTILTIFAALLVVSLVFYFVICPSICDNSSEHKDTSLRENNSYSATSIYFSKLTNGEKMNFKWLVDTDIYKEGTLTPDDNIAYSFRLLEGNTLQYKLVTNNTYNLIKWFENDIDMKLRTYVDLIYIKLANPQECPSDKMIASRKVKLIIPPSLSTKLTSLGVCGNGFMICAENTGECKEVGDDGYFKITVSIDEFSCKANGLVLKCKDNTLLGKLTLDDPDDVEIRVVLGGILDNRFLEFRDTIDQN